MANKKDKNNIKDERIEDTTMYGEFVSSFHNWISPDRQRKVARHLEEISEETSSAADDFDKKDKKKSN